MTMLVSALQVRERVLEPAMEATALNFRQARLLYDPSEPVDSLLELLAVRLRGGAEEHELAALRVCRELAAVNGRERTQVLAIAGVADAWAIELHGAELAGEQPAGLAINALAGLLRGPLGVLCEPLVEPLTAVAAVRAIDLALAGVPRSRITDSSLEHQLGGRRYRTLLKLLLPVEAVAC